ncbi:hypothetical protein GE09DRAFT_1241893 [Coniochaeta sp. 2T2.1]|nr:hypothetical protein GE09DRAFT_1241893 [Coniochaeta sp. 2T2.1]
MYSASGPLSQKPSIDRLKPALGLKGIELDDITMVGERKRQDIRGEPCVGWLHIFDSLATTYMVNTKQEERKLNGFWRTLIANTAGYPPQLLPKGSHPLGAPFAKRFFIKLEDGLGREWLSRAKRFAAMLDGIWDREAREAASWTAFDEPYVFCRCLRLFRTDKGYLGLGTECLGPGDEVWIVPGSRVPLILWRLKGDSSSPGRHRLVGGTYLHGVMEGGGVSPSVTGLTAEEVEASMEPLVLL